MTSTSPAHQVWRERDAAWAGLALQHAQQLYAFGRKHPGCFSQSVPEMGAVYQSTAWRDDMAWGAAWLHAATQEPRYEQQAHAYLHDSKSAEADRCAGMQQLTSMAHGQQTCSWQHTGDGADAFSLLG